MVPFSSCFRSFPASGSLQMNQFFASGGQSIEASASVSIYGIVKSTVLSPGVCSNSYPLSQWCHPIISSSAIPVSSFLQSFPALGSFPMSWLFISGGHSIESSASASVVPMSSQGRFPVGLTGLISWKSRDFQESSPAPQFKSISCLVLSLFYGSTLTSVHDYWKNYSFDYMDFHRQSDVSVF